MEIRAAQPADEAHWRRLWRGYADFYETHLAEEVTSATWRRIISASPAILCRIAEENGQLLGFSHSVLHEGSWALTPVCYLEDLFVDPSERGHGVGRALIADLAAMAQANGWSHLYWHTRESNEVARRLYDSFVSADDFVRYRLKLQKHGVPMSQEEEAARRHRTKMEKRKAIQDAEVASKPIDAKGLLMVHTGPGKGKSTAAFGLALRGLGHGWKVAVVQFGKGAWQSGERTMLEKLGGDRLSWHTLGEGFTWETQDRARDEAAARRAWDKAQELMKDPELRLLVLDELNIALRYDHLNLEEVIVALKARRNDLHIVVTGRNAKPELIAAADLVTEMTLVKHHFAAGVKAQEGIEF